MIGFNRKAGNAKLFITTCCIMLLSMLLIPGAKASFAISREDSPVTLFGSSADITLQANMAGSSLTDGSGTVLFPNENKSGVMISAENNTSIALDKTFGGAFEMDLRVWADQTITDDNNWKDFGSYDGYNIREVTLQLDDGENTIEIYIAGGDYGNAVRTTMRVGINGSADRYAYQYDGANGKLSSYRANSYGTWLFGSSFVNKARSFATFKTVTGISTKFGFDPESMTVYGFGDPSDNVNNPAIKYTVWKLDSRVGTFSGPQPTEPQRILSSFGDNYSVTMSLDVQPGKTGKVVMYSVNGQSLAGESNFNYDSGPMLLLKNMPAGRVGQPYDLSQGVSRITDFFEGDIAKFSGDIAVEPLGGQSVLIAPQEGQYIYTPELMGDYIISYRARDSKGNYSQTQSIDWAVNHAKLTSGQAISDLYEVDTSALITTDYSAPQYYVDGTYGVKMTANSSCAVFRYKHKLQLDKNTPFIELGALTSAVGKYDYDRIVLTLTDAFDSNNYMRVNIQRGLWGNEFSYIRAGTANIRLGGYNLDKKEMQYGETHGFVAYHSFTGEGRGGKSMPMGLIYDNEEKKLSVTTAVKDDNVIVDFDNPKYLDSQSAWAGFNSDEAYLSISLERFAANKPASLLVKSINGQSMEGKYLYDTKPPRIILDTNEYSTNNPPVAEINRLYKVFDAAGYDEADGQLEFVNIKAYYNYKTAEQREITISQDNLFAPDVEGKVTIEYTAQDNFGNIATKTYDISVMKQIPAISFVFDSNIPSNIFVGERLEIPTYIVTGGSGRKQVEIALLKGTQNVEFDGAWLYLPASGSYTLRALVTDYLGQERIFDYSITATISPKPIMEIGDMHPVLIKNKSYSLPEVRAFDWSDGTPKQVPVSIKAGVGDNLTSVTDKLIPNDIGLMKIVFSAGNSDDLATKTLYAEVVSGEGIEGLFATDNVSVKSHATGLIIYAYKYGKVVFANPIYADMFSINLSLYQSGDISYGDFGKLTITLYEAGNRKNSASASFSPSELNNLLLDAKPFSQLSGKMVYMEISLEEVADTSAVIIRQLVNQPFTASPYDIIKPIIALQDTMPSEVKFGQIFSIPAAKAFDVFDPNTVVGVNIVAPDGYQISDFARINEPITLVADKYGYINIEYVAYDSNGNRLTLSYTIRVRDSIAPNIMVQGSVQESAKLGKSISLPTAIASDNLTEDVIVLTLLIEPDGKMTSIGNTFVSRLKGNHTVRYYAVDEEYNYTYIDYTIIVG